ncbi:MAG TPA: endonuclease/exonuclease/phosphatase family protein [Gemmatimonadaceae bacterium]|nr:endonuclease/exonuclease/phosphatase family protein [Gemmatimonadaceae bacterium]
MITSSRMLVFALAAMGIAACASLPAIESRPADAPPRTIRVMTYNIQYGGGGKNLDSIIGVIRTAAPTIVALQEVDVHWSERSSFQDQAMAIARALDMEVRFAPIYTIADSGGARPPRQFGVALLSRFPILSFTNHPLTRLSTQDSTASPQPMPGFLEALIDVRGSGRLRVFNTHLDYRRDPAVRRRQVAEMLERIGPATTATILFGDLNASSDAPELQPLFQRLTDAWPAAKGPGFTIPADQPERRIDYVLVSPGLTGGNAWVPATAASDHRPVVVEIEAPRAR